LFEWGLEGGGVKIFGNRGSPPIVVPDASPSRPPWGKLALIGGIVVLLIALFFVPIAYQDEPLNLPLDLVAGKTFESREFEVKEDWMKYTFFIEFNRIDGIVSPQVLFCRAGVNWGNCLRNEDVTLAFAWRLREDGEVIRSGVESDAADGGGSSNTDFRRYFSGTNLSFYGTKNAKYQLNVEVLRDGDELNKAAPRIVGRACVTWWGFNLRAFQSEYRNAPCY
jgi:hypothetical protein